MKLRTTCNMIVLTLLVIGVSSVHAELRLSLDARAPGSNSGQWADLSGKNSPFEAVGTPTLTTNSAGDVYRFEKTDDDPLRDSFVGSVADEANFDFETSIAGSADPFTVVMHLNTLWGGQSNRNEPILRKHSDSRAEGGWSTTMASDWGDRIPVARQWGQNGDNRAQATFYQEGSSGIAAGDTDMHLLMFHFPGDGDRDNTQVFVDGVLRTHSNNGPNNLELSTLNDQPLTIGRDASGTADFKGEIQFIEIYSGTSIDNNLGSFAIAEYAAARFDNLGSIVVPEPATLILLVMAGLALIGWRRK